MLNLRFQRPTATKLRKSFRKPTEKHVFRVFLKLPGSGKVTLVTLVVFPAGRPASTSVTAEKNNQRHQRHQA